MLQFCEMGEEANRMENKKEVEKKNGNNRRKATTRRQKKGFNKQKGSMFKRVKTGLRKVPTQR